MDRSRIAVLSLLLASVSNAAVPTDWTLQLQCRSSLDPEIPSYNMPGLTSLSSQYVTLDEDGTVAIRVFVNAPGITEGIFVGNDGVGGLALTGNNLSDPIWSTQFRLRNGRFGIGDFGFNQGANVYNDDGTLSQAFAIGGSEGTSGYGSIDMTDQGKICYRGDFGFVGDKTVLDWFDGGVRQQRLVADSFSGTYSFIFAPKVNDAEQVASNTIPQTGPSRRIVRWEADNTPTTIAETGGTYNSFVNSIGLAENGQVAFSARRSADSIWEVNAGDGSTVTTVATGANPDIDNSSLVNFPPVASSNGWVAFRATDITNDSTALWVGDGDSLVKLAEAGQVVDTDLGPLALGFDFGGTTGVQVMNGVIDINSAGQIAFAAFFENGTIGVFVATPVEEPGGCSLADLAEPFGVLNFFDLGEFLTRFNAQDPSVDFAAPFGVWNFFDLGEFLTELNQGCP